MPTQPGWPLSTSRTVSSDLLTLSPPSAASTCSESPTQSATHTIRLAPLFNQRWEPFSLTGLPFALPGTDLRGHSTQSLPSSRAPAPHTGRIACLSLLQSVSAFMCMQQFSCTALLPREDHIAFLWYEVLHKVGGKALVRAEKKYLVKFHVV